jgi:hypothetical protein
MYTIMDAGFENVDMNDDGVESGSDIDVPSWEEEEEEEEGEHEDVFDQDEWVNNLCILRNKSNWDLLPKNVFLCHIVNKTNV